MSNSFSVNDGSKKELRKLSVEGCPVIGEGAHAVVYKTQPDEIVKVYRPGVSLERIDSERKLARWALVKGLPTAIPFDVVSVGDSYGVVFELLNAISAVEYINSSKENLEDFIVKSVNLMNEIHSIEVEDGELPDMKQNTVKWADEIRDYLSDEVYSRLCRMIDLIPESHTLLHADFHVKNIMVSKGELMLIDMDTLSKGDPIFELATVYNSYREFPDIDPEAAAFLGISVDMGREIWDKTLKLYCSGAGEEIMKQVARDAQILGCVRIINFMNRHKEHPAYSKSVDHCLKDINDKILDIKL